MNAEWYHVVFVWDGSQRKLSVDIVVVVQDKKADLRESDSGP